MKKNDNQKIRITKNTAIADPNRHKLSEGNEIVSEERFRNLLANIEEGYFEVDLDGKFTFLNDSVCKVLGYSKSELIGVDSKKFTDKEDVEKAFQAYKTVYKNDHTIKNVNWRVIRKDNSKRCIEGAISLRKDLSAIPIGFRVIANDVTERKNMEESLRKSEEKYRTILENIEEGYYEVDLAGNFTFFNDSVSDILGYSKDELMGMNNRQYTDKEHSEKLFKAFNNVFTTGEPSKGFDWQIIRKNGTRRYIEASVSLKKDASNKPIGFRGIIHDITERKQIEEKLHDEEQRFRSFAEQSSDIILLVNKKGLITYLNPAVRILGISPEERIGSDVFERVHPNDIKLVSDAFIELFNNTNAPIKKAEVRIRHSNGEWFTFEVIGSNLVRNNVVEAAIVNLRDITERKIAGDKLRKTLENLRKSYGITIKVLIAAVEMRDPYTAGHQSRSADMARGIAKEMGLSDERIDGMRMAGSIHDIGKLSVPSEILSRPTKLTNIEFSMIKEHAQSGYEMLKNVESPWPLAEIIYQHHERMDGSGYPRHLKGDEIILEARIMAVSDVVEAMSSHRPYRASLGVEAALEEIERNKGILYDRDVVEACLRLFREKGYNLIKIQ
jgi:PAS domain S-box-containing protein